MAELPPSLGQEKTRRDYRLLKMNYPLPTSRPELVKTFEEILGLGGVQKVIVEIGEPIEVTRYVPNQFDVPDPGIPEELLSDDIFSNIRNSPMEEFDPDTSRNWYEGLFRAFNYLGQKNLKPKAFMVKSLDLLRNRLEIDKTLALTELFGVEVSTSDEIPPDVLLFAATKPGEEEIALSLRILMNAPRRKS